MQSRTTDELVMALAFAIEDPCGKDELDLARALIDLGRGAPGSRRVQLTNAIKELAGVFQTIEKAQDHG